MIQRIQSVYLLIAAICMLLFYMFPIAVFTTEAYTFEFFNCHITHPENLEPPIALLPLAVLPVLSMLLGLVVIFLFKNRKLQMRINKINMLVVISVIAIAGFYFSKIRALLNGEVSYGFALVFPILTIVFLILANRAINYDEKLVRAADRIR
ncbi:MAG: DUF4293 domain-containing protein [Salinivirgaceae bacterium]|jgi:peptidoglycan/LPS O-acetylase OafA/YrhL|nr:DUF4293 domain-containing protein [Salinivirgaceae bacterium]